MLVPPRDPSALAGAITQLLADADHGPLRVQHPVDRFTEQAAVSEYLQVLGAGASG
jgi:hypothetical protein